MEREWVAKNAPDALMLPIDKLEPYTKIINEAHYNLVIQSIELEGLMNPLVILLIDEDEWHRQFIRDHGATLGPGTHGPQIRHRVQCGNHRYWALRDYFGVKEVPCEVYDDPQGSMKACSKYRRSKEWKELSPNTLL